jgi:HPt (histidine-containing phosphotransfer) domain-containing protein
MKSMDQPSPNRAQPDAGGLFDREDFVERLMGNEELAKRILNGFVEDMPRQLARLAQALNSFDADTVRVVAHSIKGAAANVSGLEMREIAQKLERTGSSGDLAVAAALPELSASFERVKPAMESFCGRDPKTR